jgi:thiamine-monophosphate kinase
LRAPKTKKLRYRSFLFCRINPDTMSLLRPQYLTEKYVISRTNYGPGCQPARLLDFDLFDESTITEKLRKTARIPPGSPVVLGIGDDCAIYRPRGSAEDLLFTCDLVIEDVHFVRETHTAADLGHKALARGLSDIAAMGGEPRFCLVALCLPAWASHPKWADKFFGGLLELAGDSATVVAGGDLSHGEKLACDVTVCGAVPRGTALRRDGARPGHDVYVSGELGGAALGLESLKGKARRRYLRPEPRLALGRFLRDKLRATAAMDLSDGLSLDLRRLCLASGVAAKIVAPPCFPGAGLARSLHGGEDYELLFTVRTGTRVPKQFEGVRLTRIGTIVKGPAGTVQLDGEPLPPLGYDHFAPKLTRME